MHPPNEEYLGREKQALHGSRVFGTALLHRMRLGKITWHVSALLAGPALDLKTHFINRFQTGVVNDSRDCDVLLAIGTCEGKRVHVMREHEQFSLAVRE